MERVLLTENSASESTVEATFQAAGGLQASLRVTLRAGQAYVRTSASQGIDRLRVEASCRFAVLPDFFADDLVLDARELPNDRVKLPSEHFLLHMIGSGEAMVLVVWTRRDQEVDVTLAGRAQARCVEASEIPFGAKGEVCVAVLDGPGIWHCHEVRKADSGQVIGLGWKAPFHAQWRVDWRRDSGLTESWEMLVEGPDGSYAKLDWFGQPDKDGTPDWLKLGRQRWTAALGHFDYPCWIDQQGRGYLQPPDWQGQFEGPSLIYPLDRSTDTPLAAFTLMDIMRGTLGLGPCEYLLDVEGQKKRFEGMPTCVARQKLSAIYRQGEQIEKRVEVERILEQELAFIRHIRARIEDYVAFGNETLAYLEQERKRRPELVASLEETEKLACRIDAAVDSRRSEIGMPQEAGELVEQFRTTVLGNGGDDAMNRFHAITARLSQIGDLQDSLVGQCRMAVKVLRQRVALMMAADPRTTAVAEEIRRRTWAILRNPTSFEAPRQ
jgi:hypothetical protein